MITFSTKSGTKLGVHVAELSATDVFGETSFQTFSIQVVERDELLNESTSNLKINQAKLYLPYLKRDGTALIRLSCPQSPQGLGQLSLQLTNATFKITLFSDDEEKETVGYTIL